MSKLKSQLFSGILYMGIGRYVTILISLVITAVLSRILEPAEFGVVAIATFFINFFSTLSITGITPAIIQNQDLTKEKYNYIFTFTFYLGIAMGLFFAALAPYIARYYTDLKHLEAICYILSINIFFSILSIVPNAILLKSKEFRFISIRTIVIQIIVGIVAVVAALNGVGVFALLINPIIGSILLFILSIRKIPLSLMPKFEWPTVKLIFSYSLYQMLFNLIHIVYRGIDKILIGKFFSATSLGYYEKSYRLMMLPLENISSVMNPVLHPVLSGAGRDKEFIFTSYCRITKILSLVGFLLTSFLYFTSHELVILFFGDKWLPSVPVFQILSLSVGIQIAQAPIAAVFQSLNKVKCLAITSFFVLISVLLSISYGLYTRDLNMVAIGLVVSFFMAYLIYHISFCRINGFSFFALLKVLIRPIVMSLPLGGLLFVYSLIVLNDNLLLNLCAKAGICLLYMCILVIMGELDDLPLVKKIRIKLT